MKKYWLVIIVVLATIWGYFVVAPAFAGVFILPNTLSLGVFQIRIYGIIMALSMLVGFLVARKYSWRFGIDKSEVENFAFYLIICAFLGARLYFIGFAWNYFSQNLGEIYKIWHGGLSIYGALISGVIFTWVWSRRKAYGFRQLLDLLGLSLPLAQALGRWGNFFNQEAYGLPTNLPWKMFISPQSRPQVFANSEYFHPTFLYESLLMIVVFFILLKLMGKHKPGVLGFAYIGLYSLVRFFVEPLRLDSVWVGGFRADQIVALTLILLSAAFIIKWQIADTARDVAPID